MTAAANSTRPLKIKALHVKKNAAGMDDETYRAKLEVMTGKRSAKDLSDDELDRVLASFHVKQKANYSYTSKVKALWIALWNLGALEAGDDRALDAFVKRQTGKERLGFITSANSNLITEALKAMCAREDFEIPANDAGGLEARRALLRAQWKKLAAIGAVRIGSVDALDVFVSHRFVAHRTSIGNLNRQQLDQAAIALGKWLRKALKERK